MALLHCCLFRMLIAQVTIDVTANEQLIKVSWFGTHKQWLQTTILTIFVLLGQSIATLLGRLYFDKGGNSIWLLTLTQTIGFPTLIPFLFFAPIQTSKNTNIKKPFFVLLCVFLGIFLATICVLYSIGLLYLPVSTYSLICASQLGFNVVFSFFLNQEKLTPFVINSVFILTLSSVLLVFQNDSSEAIDASKRKYVIGFICTISASAGYALLLSFTQFSYKNIVKDETFTMVLTMIIYQSMVSSFVILIGIFVSGDWKSLSADIENFDLGKVLYVMILVCKAVSWQVFSIGTVGLTFKVSSLFSNVISTVGLPIVPVLAVVFFHDKMNGVKIVSMVMAIWGFLSYMYQHYLNDLRSDSQSEVRGPNKRKDTSY